jgi:hypothetical protein
LRLQKLESNNTKTEENNCEKFFYESVLINGEWIWVAKQAMVYQVRLVLDARIWPCSNLS